MLSEKLQGRESTAVDGDHIKNYLRKLISSKSMGPDSLHSSMLGKLSNVLVRTFLKGCGDEGKSLITVQNQMLHP